MNLFSSASKNMQIGIDFQPAGVAVAQVQMGKKLPGSILACDFLPAVGQQAQTDALQAWVRANNLQKCACVCLIATNDCNIYQIEKPPVEEAELIPALTWKIKDLISYDVGSAVVDFYPMPVSNKNNTQQVSVVTAQESTVAGYVECIKSTGLKLNAIDVHSLACANLKKVQQSTGQTMAILSLSESSGFLNIFHDTDLYVSRDFKIGTSQLAQVTSEDQSTYDALLLEIQRSMDYFESYYGQGSVSNLIIFPQLPASEKMAMYLQNLTNFDIDFVDVSEPEGNQASDILDAHCFHAYGAALRGITF